AGTTTARLDLSGEQGRYPLPFDRAAADENQVAIRGVVEAVYLLAPAQGLGCDPEGPASLTGVDNEEVFGERRDQPVAGGRCPDGGASPTVRSGADDQHSAFVQRRPPGTRNMHAVEPASRGHDDRLGPSEQQLEDFP